MLYLAEGIDLASKQANAQNAVLRAPTDSQENSKHSGAKDSVWSYMASTLEDPMLNVAARVPQNPDTPSKHPQDVSLLRKGG